ncbi:MAG: hypothetical protein ACYDDF_04450 [Thermoplasmatota archaeon]
MRAALAAWILLAASFAGCMGSQGHGSPSPSIAPSSAVDNSSLTMPDNRSGTFSAFNETNMTDQMGAHAHDYWAGRTRVLIADTDTQFPWPAIPGVDPSQNVTVHPTRGDLVYEGTARVEILLSNPQFAPFGAPLPSPPGGTPAITLSYQTAAQGGSDWIDGGPVSFDTVLAIPIKAPQETDMPHSAGSLWQFRFATTSGAGTRFHVQIAIIRGDAKIPLWPGHPLFYAKSHYRVLIDTEATERQSAYVWVYGPIKTKPNETIVQAGPGRLVSAGTATLFLYVNISDLTTAPGLSPTNLRIVFHNATWDTWNTTVPASSAHAITSQSMHQVFVLKVDPNGMDSPYASASRWQFQVRTATTGPASVLSIALGTGDGTTYCDGCSTYSMTFHLTIVATDLAAPHYDAVVPDAFG